MIRVQFPAGAMMGLLLFATISKASSGAHPAFCPIGTRVLYPGCEVNGV